MIDETEAQQLMETFILLREKANSKLPQDIQAYKKHENLCIEKFKYIITNKTSKYKSFSNYDDLNQEGYGALMKAMKNYNPKKGSWFWWAHKYIDTKISRCANFHSVIRYPLKVAKQVAPHKELVFPLLIEKHNPETYIEQLQINNLIHKAINSLTSNQKDILNLAFGLDGNKPLSINKICQTLNISRPNCNKELCSALSVMKDIIKL
jgi:RNA polymerase sigma factor (sigma-70 family)